MELYTIGFAQKSAREFFRLLNEHGVKQLVDIRIHPQGQLAGFARQEDLPYFLAELAGGCRYLYLPALAPTPELLKEYRQDKDWERYLARFDALMQARDIPAALDRSIFETLPSCLLCSEPTPEHCHRRLVAERLASHWPGLAVIHL
ncbi:MAG TPA: DUF488 domain-containing protein [Anaerolineales bacterium]|nr:DUF488 domain-containing protein [Anaerolineales bacterium]